VQCCTAQVPTPAACTTYLYEPYALIDIRSRRRQHNLTLLPLLARWYKAALPMPPTPTTIASYLRATQTFCNLIMCRSELSAQPETTCTCGAGYHSLRFCPTHGSLRSKPAEAHLRPENAPENRSPKGEMTSANKHHPSVSLQIALKRSFALSFWQLPVSQRQPMRHTAFAVATTA